MIFHWFP
jgi:hypothetical protein